MSVASEVAAFQTADVCLGTFWVRVRLLSTPASMQAGLALRLAAGVGESALKPKDKPKATPTPADVARVLAAHVPIVCEAVEAMARSGPAAEPIEWAPCKIVPNKADEDLDRNVMAFETLDKLKNGATGIIVGVASHVLFAEAGVLRPFSMNMPSSSA